MNSWVPIYYENGVTIGKAKVSDDETTIEITLNEGSDVGALINRGLVGLSTIALQVNDAQEQEPNPVVEDITFRDVFGRTLGPSDG
jgi:hypothetical protein